MNCRVAYNQNCQGSARGSKHPHTHIHIHTQIDRGEDIRRHTPNRKKNFISKRGLLFTIANSNPVWLHKNLFPLPSSVIVCLSMPCPALPNPTRVVHDDSHFFILRFVSVSSSSSFPFLPYGINASQRKRQAEGRERRWQNKKCKQNSKAQWPDIQYRNINNINKNFGLYTMPMTK